MCEFTTNFALLFQKLSPLSPLCDMQCVCEQSHSLCACDLDTLINYLDLLEMSLRKRWQVWTSSPCGLKSKLKGALWSFFSRKQSKVMFTVSVPYQKALYP